MRVGRDPEESTGRYDLRAYPPQYFSRKHAPPENRICDAGIISPCHLWSYQLVYEPEAKKGGGGTKEAQSLFGHMICTALS